MGVPGPRSFSPSELAHIPPFYQGLHHSKSGASEWLWLALDDVLKLLGRHCFRVSGSRSFSQPDLAHIPPFYEGLHHPKSGVSGWLWKDLDDVLKLLGRHCFGGARSEVLFPIRIGAYSSILSRVASLKIRSFRMALAGFG